MSSPAPLLPTDPRRIGSFRVHGRLGAGGMGTVYAATDPTGRPAAVKTVHREFAADHVFRARFAREVELVRTVTGHCVPGFLDADTRAVLPWLAIEFVQGPTLGRHVREHGPLAGDALIAFAAGIAEALTMIHSRGVVHRDLKPGNVILSPNGPKVLDFGIARAIDSSGITRTGQALGTPGWVPPEIFHGGAPSTAGDVFVWGSLVSYAATGRPPFGRGTPQAVAARIIEHPADTEGVPEGLLPWVDAALAKERAERPTAEHLMRAVVRLSGERAETVVDATQVLPRVLARTWVAPVERRTPAWAADGPRLRRRRRGGLVAAAVGSLVLVAGLGWGGARWLDQDARPPETSEEEPTTEEILTEANADRYLPALAVASNQGSRLTVYNALEGDYVKPDPGEVGLSAPPGASVPGEGTESIEVVLDFGRNTPPSDKGEFHITITAEFLPDDGAFAIHLSDFLMYGVDASVDPSRSGPDSPGYIEYSLSTADEPVLLTPDDPVTEFDLRAEIPDSAYLHYLPRPGTAWGPGHEDTPAWGTHLCADPGAEGEASEAMFTGLGAYC
ncbi:serine/threonine-protein kinase [Nocardiopsis sp. LDBS1602]|uniref:serine/threonine-protein kinase n=1 Tax=Nocardiopsis sp. LDBS1602 TaxID=3109597 RepID=UPI002DBA29BC|nr:serine/threonine-protein kinase [Nocardiopsis sp. LDBS1602]MEC3895645.1 serine/threonine-protein kinase [Nocardiopsis sp. LDBS1602]